MRHNLNTSQDDLVKPVRVAATEHQLFQFNGHPYEQIDVNIEVVPALYKSYWATMNKIFIYAHPYIEILSIMTCSAVIFVSLPEYQVSKISGNDEKRPTFFLEISF